MSIAIIKIKIMPLSPEANLNEIKEDAEKIIKNYNGNIAKIEEESIAFGLIAIIITFTISESQELEPIEQELNKIENVSSSQVIDMRRSL